MQKIDLFTTSEKDVRWLINKHCGGKYTMLQRLRRRGTGFGGLYYTGGWADIDSDLKSEDPLRANMEVFRQGYGVYLRNSSENHLILLTYQDLHSIRLGMGPARLRLQLNNGEKVGFEFIKNAESKIVNAVSRIFGPLQKDSTGYFIEVKNSF